MEITAQRYEIHAHPDLFYEIHRTTELVATVGSTPEPHAFVLYCASRRMWHALAPEVPFVHSFAMNVPPNVIITFRIAHAAERLDLEALQMRASLVWEEDRDALLAHPDAVHIPPEQIADGCTIVAECAGRTVGFAIVLARPDGDRELDGLFVEPDIWRAGIGMRLIAEALAMTAAGGAQALHVIANPRALGFYQRCGFVVTGETRTRFGIGFLMSKPAADVSSEITCHRI